MKNSVARMAVVRDMNDPDPRAPKTVPEAPRQSRRRRPHRGRAATAPAR